MYYSLKNKKLIFCSEIKGTPNPINDFNQNDKSIIDFIKWGGLDHSNQTWFKNIFSLNPGSFIVIDKKFLIVEKKFYFLNQRLTKKRLKKKIFHTNLKLCLISQ